jgi:hypothetical protein
MKIRMLAVASTMVLVSHALAQDAAAPLNGTWYGEIQMPGGLIAEVQMRVEGPAGGTWTVSPRGGKAATPNPCLGRPLPLAITEADGAFKLHIQAAQEVKGCSDGRATLKRTDERHLEGNFADGRSLKLARR